jgi:hypothetical protein
MKGYKCPDGHEIPWTSQTEVFWDNSTLVLKCPVCEKLGYFTPDENSGENEEDEDIDEDEEDEDIDDDEEVEDLDE